ncbi:MAG: ABC transporter substrate-binding protein [Thermoprotei archaeon]
MSIPGPTLYLGSVTSAPYTSASEVSSDGYVVALSLGLKAYVDLWPIIPLLNGSNVNCGLSSYKMFPSNNTYVLVLRKGLRWSNGYPLNSTTLYDQLLFDIIAYGLPVYYPKIINSTAVSVYYPPGVVGGLDEYSSPSFFFIVDLAGSGIYIYPPYWTQYMKYIQGNLTALASGNNAVRTQLFNMIMNVVPRIEVPPKYPFVSSGPYVLSAVTPSEFILTRNPYYWDEKSYPWNSIVWYQFTSPSAQQTFILSGKVDKFDGFLAPSIMAELPSYWKLGVIPVLTGNDLVFNFNSNWVSILQVREAIAYAVNRTKVVEASSMQPYYTTLQYPISWNPWDYSALGQSFLATLNRYPYNLTKASELMKSAGFVLKNGQWYASNGTPVTLTLLSSPTSGASLAELEDTVSQLDAFGLPTTILMTSNPSYAETGKGFNLYWGRWGWWGPAWDVFIQPAALDNGLGGSHYMNFLKPVYVPKVGNISFLQLFNKARAGSPNLTQETIWLQGLAYIENHYCTDIPLDGEENIYGINSRHLIAVTNNSIINLAENQFGGELELLEGQLGLIHLPITSISIFVAPTSNVGQQVNITAKAYTYNGWVAPATELEFIVNGVKVGTALTNYNGTASITYTPSSSGTYSVQVQPSYNTSVTGSASFNAVVQLVPSAISLTLSSASVTVGTPVTVSATVTASNGQSVANTPIGFFVNGASIGSAVTNSEGVASVSYTPTSSGTFTVRAQSTVETSVTGTATLTVTSPQSPSNTGTIAIAIAVAVVVIVVTTLLLLQRRGQRRT